MKPKTIKTYIKMLSELNKIPLEDLKGFDKLSEEERKIFVKISSEISNSFGDMESFKHLS
jgi:hypothetical protein